MFEYNLFTKVLFFLRDIFSKKLFQVLRTFCRGHVLDVGGASFFLTAIQNSIPFDSWTVLEPTEQSFKQELPKNVQMVIGDGTKMEFPDESFDTILNIQVLEHTFEPYKMFAECVRVLKKDCYGIFLIPQTSTMHLAPYHYQNFLRFWIEEACRRSSVEIILLQPIGGWWVSHASRTFYFFLSAFRRHGNSVPEIKRNKFFYILMPIMILYALVSIPFCLLLGLGDLQEEPTNHLLVVRKGNPSC